MVYGADEIDPWFHVIKGGRERRRADHARHENSILRACVETATRSMVDASGQGGFNSGGPTDGTRRAAKRTGWLSRLGLRRRIMLYVTIGLAIMFGTGTLLDLQSIQRATELVYEERLIRAYTIAGFLQQDFLHAARDAREEGSELLGADAGRRDAATRDLLAHLADVDPFRFFRVTGVWVIGADGRVVAAAGRPSPGPDDDGRAIVSAVARSTGEFVVLPAVSASDAGIAFGSIAVPMPGPGGSGPWIVAVHTVSVNSLAPYVPAAAPPADDPRAQYHLEILGPDGRVLLGIGEDETPGFLSRHASIIESIMAEGKAASLLHRPSPGNGFEPHVMVAVPIASSSFYMILEQPVDVALALPIELQRRLAVITTLGFVATLAVAWVTTGRVVRPVQQLTSAAHHMAAGNLEDPIRVAAGDELGELADSLDTMRRQLRAAHGRLGQANAELEAQVRERTARLGELLREIISAQEEERYRLARELHDETAQTLGALSIALDRARDALPGGVSTAGEQIAEAKAIATRLLEETRRLILDLRPLVLDDLGLAPAIRWYAETHLEDEGVTTTVEIDQLGDRLPKHIEVSLFRVVQEAVNNIAKHAEARRARIRIDFRDALARVEITDDGRGFDAERIVGSSASVGSVGLLGMQERVRLLGGRLRITSRPGEGTILAVEIPMPAKET
ncbi:MAG: HAMP domain-containing protein [Chloroflexota bacterium]|nr:MAG: HAMP domain-containing protein [Chloroflexota bacterium]